MRGDKKEALQLRTRGKSYKEIKEILGVPKSTLSDWLRDTEWSTIIKNNLSELAKVASTIRLQRLNDVRGSHLASLYRAAEREAREEFECFKFHPTFISGISIYWGEGDKATKHLIRVGNTDPLMIRLFVKFLLDVCGISKEKIRAHVLIYPDLDPSTCTQYWIKHSGLSVNSFNKCVVVIGKHKTRRLPYGVCYVTVSSAYFKKKMFIWLKLLPKELIKGKYYARE